MKGKKYIYLFYLQYNMYKKLPLGPDVGVPQRDLDLAGPPAGSQVQDQGVPRHAGRVAI